VRGRLKTCIHLIAINPIEVGVDTETLLSFSKLFNVCGFRFVTMV
jgi:hypothetical protein